MRQDHLPAWPDREQGARLIAIGLGLKLIAVMTLLQ